MNDLKKYVKITESENPFLTKKISYLEKNTNEQLRENILLVV